MKNINYHFTEGDIKAITYAMEIIPVYNFMEAKEELDISYALTVSTGPKLILHQQLNDKEICYIALSIDCAYKALRNEMTLEAEALTGLQPYMFIINKLHPIFSPLLEI